MNRIGNRARERLAALASYGLLLLLVMIIGAPLLWMVSGSLRTTREIYAVPPVWIPAQPRISRANCGARRSPWMS